MKSLTYTICTVLLILFAVTGYSQSSRSARPLLFASLPSTINCTEAQLSKFFVAASGKSVSVPLSTNFVLSGSVISNQQKFYNLQTVVIKLAGFNNTLFSLSKQTNQHSKDVYVGRIINPLYADGFELKQTAGGNYQLNKINLDKILVDCNQ